MMIWFLTKLLVDGQGTTNDHKDQNPAVKAYVPLQFWFCRNPGLALPLIALQYHEVKVNLDLDHSDLVLGADTTGTTTMTSCQTLC